jgi:hypothetical protein
VCDNIYVRSREVRKMKIRWMSDKVTDGNEWEVDFIRLCEACFLEEDAEIETEGTNNLPDRIKQYCENERLGILKKQWS